MLQVQRPASPPAHSEPPSPSPSPSPHAGCLAAERGRSPPLTRCCARRRNATRRDDARKKGSSSGPPGQPAAAAPSLWLVGSSLSRAAGRAPCVLWKATLFSKQMALRGGWSAGLRASRPAALRGALPPSSSVSAPARAGSPPARTRGAEQTRFQRSSSRCGAGQRRAAGAAPAVVARPAVSDRDPLKPPRSHFSPSSASLPVLTAEAGARQD
jgi:hypothetical protein